MKEQEFTEAKVDCPIYKIIFGQTCRLECNCNFGCCPFVYWINKNEELTQKKIEIQEDG